MSLVIQGNDLNLDTFFLGTELSILLLYIFPYYYLLYIIPYPGSLHPSQADMDGPTRQNDVKPGMVAHHQDHKASKHRISSIYDLKAPNSTVGSHPRGKHSRITKDLCRHTLSAYHILTTRS